MKKTAIIWSFILFVAGVAYPADLPIEIQEFRDNPVFFRTVRGLDYPNLEIPKESNIDKLITSWDFVYRKYLRELFKGFVSERKGELEQARIHYLKCLSIPVHEEQSYYTHLDLSRIFLKQDKAKEAEQNLNRYIQYYSEEIRGGEGELTDTFFGYVPSREVLPQMKKKRDELKHTLKLLSNYNKKK